MACHDGELAAAAAKKVRDHLEGCEECSSLLAALEQADHATGSAAVPGPDSSYWDTFTGRVMDKVKEEAPIRKHGSEKVSPRSLFSPFRFAPALSVALVVVVAAGVLMKIREPAAPDQKAYIQDSSAGRDASLIRKEEDQVDLESRRAAGSSIRERGAAEPAPVKRAEEKQLGRPPSPTAAGHTSVGKEAAADDKERTVSPEEETGLRFGEGDDSKAAVSPAPEDLTSARSFMAVPLQEPVTEAGDHAKSGKPLVAEEAAQDGSWGQLAFARSLEEEGDHAQSEKVLGDLLARDPPARVQEEASILLVSVLANQNRLPEARRVLEEAQRQYPANMMIQNFRLDNREQ